MQFKMAGSPRILQTFYRLYFGFWIPTLVWASIRWPLGLMYWMARNLVMLPFNIVRPKYLRAVKGNYSRILGLPADHPEVRRLAWEMGYQHAYHWIDFFRWSQLSPEQFEANIEAIEGEQHFQAARASKRGTLFLTAHMGNPEAGAVGLGTHFEPVHVLYWRDRFATAEEFRTRMRLRGNVHGIPVDASPFSVVPALRVLENGGIVAAHGDRDFSGQGWPVQFFGATAKFPPGPFMLAARSGALVLPTFFLLTPQRRFHVIYEEPVSVSGNGDVEARALAAMQGWAAILERRIREFPQQWYCFYPFWGEATADS
ncbi:MAG TPA: lysophospholipid acyltransferase family protein [Thermoanaerobaculaceae bacterium]|nr:lysophospholipid acyltransferase family protein [Thermoanaerobaculaceae bacterium]